MLADHLLEPEINSYILYKTIGESSLMAYVNGLYMSEKIIKIEPVRTLFGWEYNLYTER